MSAAVAFPPGHAYSFLGTGDLCMAITYRPAAEHDIQAVSDVYWASILDVYKRHGFDAQHDSLPVNPFYAFALQEEPQGFFVAVDGGKVVGATISWVRESFWFLSHLFVLPDFQGKGIGHSLLERTMNYCRTANCAHRAVITMAFNPVSVSLYLKNGLYPVEDIYLMHLGTQREMPSPGKHRGNLQGAIHLSERQQEDLAVIDREVLGTSRERHHRFFLTDRIATGYLIRYRNRPAAYVYLWPDGRIGPLAALKDVPYKELLKLIVRHAGEGHPSLALMVPGSNRAALETAFSLGFTVRMPYVLLASERFGSLDRYLFHSPGMM